MTTNFLQATQSFTCILDFIRFGISQANAHEVYYGHGTDNATDDLYALILGSLSLPPDVNPLLLQARLSEEERLFLCRQLERRIVDRVPVPYLTHEAYFCQLPFYVDERVLIPRSPIAELIDQQFAPWVDANDVVSILDLCTGSACIAIACAYAFPEAQVDAVDISPDALMVAARNVQRHAVTEQVTLIESDCFANIPAQRRYDIIVSNPPYVSMEEMQTLPVEYTHEPRLALEASSSGLDIVHEILRQARDYLTPQGILVVEVGNTQEALMQAYPQAPFTWIDFEHGAHGVFILTYEQILMYF